MYYFALSNIDLQLSFLNCRILYITPNFNKFQILHWRPATDRTRYTSQHSESLKIEIENLAFVSLTSVDRLFHLVGRNHLSVHLQDNHETISKMQNQLELTDWYESTINDGSPQIVVPADTIQSVALAVKGWFETLNHNN